MADMMSLKKWVSVPLKDTPESTDAREAVRDVSKRCSLSVVSTPGMGATAGAPGGVGARGAGTGGRRRCSCRPNRRFTECHRVALEEIHAKIFKNG